jgi:hypothetical protein
MQALVTMNDPQFVEAARALAQGALRATGEDVDSALDFMTVRVLARRFTAAERAIVRRAHADFLAQYEANSAAAAQLLAVGESIADVTLPAPGLAALTMVANQIFSLDEALNK